MRPSRRTSKRATVQRIASSAVSPEACGMAHAAHVIGDAWVLLILRSVLYGVSRFGDLQAELGIARGVLSQRLSRLIDAGLLERASYKDGTDRAREEYRATMPARELLLTFVALQQWGDKWLREAAPAGRPVSIDTGEPLRVGFVTRNGREHAASRTTMRVVSAGEGEAGSRGRNS
jgi:DNA-binding HxlR family transcriptional regulator